MSFVPPWLRGGQPPMAAPAAPSQQGVDRRRRMAEALMQIGQQGTGLQGPWGVLASALAGAGGGWMQAKAEREQTALDDDKKMKLAEALGGLAPKATNPAALDVIKSLPLEQQQQVAGQLALGQLKPAAPAEPFTLKGGETRFGPDGKQIASVAATPEPYTLSPGSQRRGANNELLAEAPNAPSATTNVTLNTEKGLYGTLAENQGKQYSDLYAQAQQAPDRIQRAQRVRELLASQPITGAGAEQKLAIARGLKTLGLYDNEDIANTELLGRELAAGTLEAIKGSGLGAGSGFSNADRDFLEKVAGGQITQDARTLAKVAELNEKAARTTAQRWNDTAKRLSPEQLKTLGMTPVDLSGAQKSQGSAVQPGQTLDDLLKGPEGDKYRRFFAQ